MPMHDCPECGAICDCRNEDACEHYRSGSCESLAGYIHDASVSDDLEKRLREMGDAVKITATKPDEQPMADALNRTMAFVFYEAADELARLRSENEALTIILNRCTEGTDWTYAQVPDEIAALKGECERLRGDAAHLDFIESLLDTTEVHIQRNESCGVRVYIDYDLTEIGVGENLRAALKEGAAK